MEKKMPKIKFFEPKKSKEELLEIAFLQNSTKLPRHWMKLSSNKKDIHCPGSNTPCPICYYFIGEISKDFEKQYKMYK